jgi:oligoendopeptidase F
MPEKKRRSANALEKTRVIRGVGRLPEWNLADLYAGIDDPKIKQDLDRADVESLAFEDAYKGRLAQLAAEPQTGNALAEAVRRYEALDDLFGRLGSYAGLVHAGNTLDPARAKFYADVQDRLTTASTHLSMMRRWKTPCRIRRWAITARGSKISARRSHTSWKIGSSSCSTRNR